MNERVKSAAELAVALLFLAGISAVALVLALQANLGPEVTKLVLAGSVMIGFLVGVILIWTAERAHALVSGRLHRRSEKPA